MSLHLKSRATAWLVTTCLTAVAVPAFAQPVPTPAPAGTTNVETGKPAADTTAPATWWDGVKFGAQFDIGATVNPVSPQNGINFGRLFDDRSNQVLMNQLLVSVARLPDPKATDYDFGFQFQALYGTDARYTQFMGELNSAFASKYQMAFINANVQAHLPWLTAGGIDVKAGQFPTPVGYEVIDPSVNPFYSHSYIFNYGLPLVATGIQTTTHLNDMFDVYLGVDSGVNTTLGAGDNNGAAAGVAGIGVNLLDGNLTILALSHFGPENPTRTVSGANSSFRYENDIVTTWKATEKLTLVTDLNFIRDDKFKANAFGVAQYVSYALNDTVTLNARGEVYRDDNGFFVGNFPENHGFVNVEYGYPATVLGAGPATYGEITLGLTWKPTLPVPYVSTFAVRPEVRYDRTLTNTKAYNDFKDRGQFTFATDLIVGF